MWWLRLEPNIKIGDLAGTEHPELLVFPLPDRWLRLEPNRPDLTDEINLPYTVIDPAAGNSWEGPRFQE